MKPIDQMNGAEKAAALLVALGPEVASEIMKFLDEESVNKLAAEIAKIDILSPEEKEELIGQFLLELRKTRGVSFGGHNVAKEILYAAFGQDKAKDILKRLTHKDLEKGFGFLNDIDAELIVTFLQNEHPQTIAVTLAYIPAAKAAEVIKLLPRESAKEVTLRMAKMERTSPDAVLEISRVLRKKYDEYRYQGQSSSKAGGLNALIDIMGHLSGDQEKQLIDYFESTMPQIADEIKARIFTFENVLTLTNTEMRILIDEINNDYMIAKALKGAGDEIRFKFFRNMSKNRATDIMNEMEAMGPVRLSEIQEARDNIVRVMRQLHDNGIISLRKEKEKYIE